MTRPEALSWSMDNCTIERAVDVFGDRWSFLVLREAFSGVRRFDDMRVRTGIPRQVLSHRLAALLDAGLLRREPYREPGQRTRLEYRLTAKGLDLYPIVVALLDWGNRYAADPEGPPVLARHRGCGSEVHAALTCDAGHVLAGPREAILTVGPGARPRAGSGARVPAVVPEIPGGV
jgi:DNA-binding HxlR family transcriptional regulator